LLQAKLVRPTLAPGLLERGPLVRGIADHASCALTLLVADAGYGKTTLLTAATAAQRRPVVWYSLMPSDADVTVFARHLLAGFRRHAPRFGRDLARILEEPRPGGPSPEMIAGTLANELTGLSGPPTLLVLDDFHEVEGCAPVVATVDALLRFLPGTARLAIASRTQPPLSLDRLRAQGQLFELDSSQLRFTRAELTRLFAHDAAGEPSAGDLDALERATRGWPTAARLVLEAHRRREGAPLARVLEEMGDSPLEVRSYVSSEVLRRLDEGDRAVLERTAALARIDAPLAQALSGRSDARARLEALARRGLLRTFGDAEPRSYEAHDLVREVVRADLLERAGEAAWRALERDTGVALRERGETEAALRHLLQAHAESDAAALLVDLAPGLLRDGRAATLLRYLTSLPPAAVDAHAALLVARADASQALGQWDEAHALYEQAMERSRTEGSRELECRALLGLGKVLNLRGRHELVLGMAERGLAMSEGLDPEVRARLVQLKASAHFYLGQSPAAVALLNQLRATLGSGDTELMVPCIHNLAVALATQGRFQEAAREFRAALALVRGTQSPRSPLYLSNLATLLTELGELGEARRAAEEGLQAAQRFANRGQEVACWTALADALVRGADLDGALAALKRAEDLNASLGMELLAADLLALRGRIFCARGQYRRAAELLNRALGRLADRTDAPRLPHFRALLAWCELRSGRAHAARTMLETLAPEADRGENEHHRMCVHYWLGEALLALGERKAAEAHLGVALARVRERGYDHFLELQAREDPAPLLHALAHGIERDRCANALATGGPSVEEPLLAMIVGASTATAEAALSVLGEVGGRATLERLPGLVRSRRALQAAARVTIRHVGERARRAQPSVSAADAPAPRLVLFGMPRLEIGGEPLPGSAWRTQRAFQILAYLALRPRGATRDELLEAFWPGRQAAAGRRNFHPTLSYLRKVLPRAAVAPLLREGESYRVHPSYPLTCDAWEFEGAREAARRARAPTETRQALERAAALAERPLLEGWYGDWADELQGRMRDEVEALMLELGEHAEKAREAERALACSRRAAELDAFRESTRVAVVRCLVALGNQRAAVVEVEKLRALLRSELGTDPLPETEEALVKALGRSAATAPAQSGQSLEPVAVVAPAQVPIKRSARV
jgi:LuxR family maltose regulon positive regulatory protein